jgi:hypothetical protein
MDEAARQYFATDDEYFATGDESSSDDDDFVSAPEPVFRVCHAHDDEA